MITFENIQPLYDKYFDLVRFEVEELAFANLGPMLSRAAGSWI
jgi:hypothetical protein